MHKICGIMTQPFGIKAFMLENLKYVAKSGKFESYFICREYDDFTTQELSGLTYIPVKMDRGNVSPLEVIKCIIRLYKIFKTQKFDIIQYASSNAGLYASIAGYLARVPVRIYCQWGISYTDFTGIKKFFYKLITKTTCFFSTDIQPDSFANLHFAISEKLYPRQKGSVIHKGSASGVNTHRFNLNNKEEWKSMIYNETGLTHDNTIFGFVGRLTPEKGINELFEAFFEIADANTRLLIVGPLYDEQRLDQNLLAKAKNDKRIVFVGEKSETAPYYSVMKFLVLPSYREGFGSVTLEAAAMRVPIICSNIKGPTDFVKDGINGILCEVKSVESLKMAMKKGMNISDMEYRQLSTNAYEIVKRDFDSDKFHEYFKENRINLLLKHNATNM